MPESPETLDVVIVGAGPVGLAAAYLLGSYGLRVQVVETRAGYSTHYRGPYLHAATAELHRRWGVFAHTKDREWNFDRVNGVTFAHSIRNEEIAVVRSAHTEAEWRALYAHISPEVPHFLPAGVQEEGLHRQASQWPGVQVDFGHELTALTQDAEGVTVRIENVQDRTQARSVRARIVVAADGARSTVSGLIGARQELAWDFGPQVFITFDGNIDQFLSIRDASRSSSPAGKPKATSRGAGRTRISGATSIPRRMNSCPRRSRPGSASASRWAIRTLPSR